jgi:hypothetical protein
MAVRLLALHACLLLLSGKLLVLISVRGCCCKKLQLIWTNELRKDFDEALERMRSERVTNWPICLDHYDNDDDDDDYDLKTSIIIR